MIVSKCCNAEVDAVYTIHESYYTCMHCGIMCQTYCSIDLGMNDGNSDAKNNGS
jgi:hypothetical protein